jgi:hypothetical protein
MTPVLAEKGVGSGGKKIKRAFNRSYPLVVKAGDLNVGGGLIEARVAPC